MQDYLQEVKETATGIIKKWQCKILYNKHLDRYRYLIDAMTEISCCLLTTLSIVHNHKLMSDKFDIAFYLVSILHRTYDTNTLDYFNLSHAEIDEIIVDHINYKANFKPKQHDLEIINTAFTTMKQITTASCIESTKLVEEEKQTVQITTELKVLEKEYKTRKATAAMNDALDDELPLNATNMRKVIKHTAEETIKPFLAMTGLKNLKNLQGRRNGPPPANAKKRPQQ